MWISGLAPQRAIAYEFSTHAAMTREAIRNSSLTSESTLLGRLGLGTRAQDLGYFYIDMGPSGDWTRSSNPATPRNFAKDRIAAANFYDSLGENPDVPSYVGWTMLGAVREDDIQPTGKEEDDTPADGPAPILNRVLNHFFDPVDETGIPVPLINGGTPAADWALGVQDGRDNHFSVIAAREAMWRALTLSRIDPAGQMVALDLPNDFPVIAAVAGEQLQPEVLRIAYWATVFRSLGDVVHLLQDMAQPQHTRFDLHGGRMCVWGSCAIGHSSYYESYVEAKAIGAARFTLKEQFLNGPAVPIYTERVTLLAPNFAGYAAPQLSNYRAYFTTDKGPQSTSGKGLANYSNQGFFTAGTNLGSSTGYVSPPRSLASFVRLVLPANSVVNANGQPIIGGSLVLFRAPVNDANMGQATMASLTSSGAFDQYLNPTGRAQFTLNHYNYDDQAALLLPRAVAYSAGILDYFFRGVIDISLPDEGVYGMVDHLAEAAGNTSGFHSIKLRVANRSPLGNDMLNGRFVLVAKYHRDKIYMPDLSGNPGGPAFTGLAARSIVEEIRISNPIQVNTLRVNEQTTLKFDLSQPIPINASDLTLQVVYRGSMGNETDAVVVGTKDISEPTFFGFANNSDYVWDQTGQRWMPLPFGGYTDPDEISNIKVRFSNTTTTPVATLSKLSVKKHAQLAVLTDVGKQDAYYDYETSNKLQTYPTVNFKYDSTQFFSPLNSGIYDANLKVRQRRGVYRQHFAGFSYPRDDILVCLVENEHCTQSTLPALLPADRVAFTINF